MSTFYGGEQIVSISKQSKPRFTTGTLSYTAPTGFYARVKYHVTNFSTSGDIITITVDGIQIRRVIGNTLGASASDEVVLPSGVNITTNSVPNYGAVYFSIEVYKNP
tara:strand:- start:111 stop:431 length:321 start_codon:yes stop_codon:yes gene_type:complete